MHKAIRETPAGSPIDGDDSEKRPQCGNQLFAVASSIALYTQEQTGFMKQMMNRHG
jgi:hypothetical protein